MKFFLLLSLIGFCWAQYNPHTQSGRTSIVHLFEWRWVDIAKECERYLAPKGFGGVQVSPPNENIVISNPSRPWWERYQPISYKICTRSGNEDEFKDMVKRCNNVGVRIYVDAVINHMCGAGGGAGTSSTCGTYYNANNRDFPGVSYSANHFNDGKCNGEINNYNDANQVRNCRLTGLLDLALDKSYVRGKVIDLGGEAIKSSEYFGNGRVTEFKYGAKLGTVIRKWSGEKMAYLKNWGEGWGFVPSDRALVFVDNHDNQRGHGAGGSSILTFWDARMYKMAVGFMLAHPYGFTRVMSSYRWTRKFQNGKDVNDWIGPPNKNGVTKEVTINADTTCGNDWVCEHRWRQIRNMVAFRNVVNGQPFSNWWDNGSNQVAFGRGNKGFIVFNNDDKALSKTLQTGLPAGTYCDVISGDKINGKCTGTKVSVGSDGKAQFSISNSAEDPFIAIHAESKL
ncbi:pancreatic alpha-amylase 2a5-like isoform X2 [Chionomys nivalis]|uniref:pancreatic alpha-amylase 2a5-like isoform X2 n=1 Tax=Chionomys nivalis TaxID=269649 RepID=UPI002597FF33|nr:pancreatic alpha-amylase 2a5-like isoform X2 [Chionomys nivalis]